MNLLDELLEVAKASELEEFRKGLLEAVKVRSPAGASKEDIEFAFVCEVGERLSDAEEFQDFIPCQGSGIGYRSRKLRVDGYEIDEVDDSIRLLITDFRGEEELETINGSRAISVFSQLRAFVEESASGKIWSSSMSESVHTKELSGTIQNAQQLRADGSRSVSRYRFYLLTDAVLSDRIKELPEEDIDGVPIEFHIWDVGRLLEVSSSVLGTEELEIDFRDFVEGGLPCLMASKTDDYEGYLCVIEGDALAKLYDRFGSRLLEGNVRSFLSTTIKINKGIQTTIRSEPDRFFVFNNGISATATHADVIQTENGPRLISAKYLQIVNGGQTTASLHVAKRKDNADLSAVHVPMKLSVVHAKEKELLDDMIQSIARYSNSQTKVNDADFFSNHPFHRAIERHSRNISAPRPAGTTTSTFWFYERTRGQYVNAQAKMKIGEKKDFLKKHPRSQLISKTDLSKYENSWLMLPHIVSRAAQKNFLVFAEFIGKHYGVNGAQFDNEVYFKEVVSKAIIFKFLENMVSAAKKSWYPGDFRAQIVTYSIAKLISIVEHQAQGYSINLNAVWASQGVSQALSLQLEEIAKAVSKAIFSTPVQNMNVGEWCKKEQCWIAVDQLEINLIPELRSELIAKEELDRIHKDAAGRAKQDFVIDAVVEVVTLRQINCWNKLLDWSYKHNPLYGRELDLVRFATRSEWVPTDRQAINLISLLNRLEQQGFRRS